MEGGGCWSLTGDFIQSSSPLNEGRRRRRRVKSHPDSKKPVMESSFGVTEASDCLRGLELELDARAAQNHTTSSRQTTDRVSELALNWNQSFKSPRPVQAELSFFFFFFLSQIILKHHQVNSGSLQKLEILESLSRNSTLG